MSDETRGLLDRARDFTRSHGLATALVLISLGTLILVASHPYDLRSWIGGQLGAAVCVTGLISLLYMLAFGKDLRVPERGNDFRAVFRNRNDLKAHAKGLHNLLRDARCRFIAVGSTLADFVHQDSKDELREAIIMFLQEVHHKIENKGKSIAVPCLILIILDPSSDYLLQRGREQNSTDGEQQIKQRMVQGLIGIKWLLNQLPVPYKRYIQLRFSSAMPLCSMFIIDDSVVYVNSYKYGERQSPWFKFVRFDGSLIDEYIDNYEELLKLSKPVLLSDVEERIKQHG